MNENNNGGPAFPTFVQNPMNGYPIEEMAGMTLRDYFAAKALQGMLADLPKTLYGLDWLPRTAAAAYEMADAMLAARTKGGADHG